MGSPGAAIRELLALDPSGLSLGGTRWYAVYETGDDLPAAEVTSMSWLAAGTPTSPTRVMPGPPDRSWASRLLWLGDKGL
jgi:hypothetical protein